MATPGRSLLGLQHKRSGGRGRRGREAWPPRPASSPPRLLPPTPNPTTEKALLRSVHFPPSDCCENAAALGKTPDQLRGQRRAPRADALTRWSHRLEMTGPKEIQVEETGPDFVIQNMEGILTKSRYVVLRTSKGGNTSAMNTLCIYSTSNAQSAQTGHFDVQTLCMSVPLAVHGSRLTVLPSYCDLTLICGDSTVLLAHCSVVAAVSKYLQRLLKEEYRENMVIMLPDVTFLDASSFLELVYTGKVSMAEQRRATFTALLELFAVIDDIGECVTFHNGLEKDLGGGVTIQRVDRNRTKAASKPLRKTTNISVNIEPVTVVTNIPTPVSVEKVNINTEN